MEYNSEKDFRYDINDLVVCTKCSSAKEDEFKKSEVCKAFIFTFPLLCLFLFASVYSFRSLTETYIRIILMLFCCYL